MLFKRYEVLLPLRYNDGSVVEEELFEQTRAYLAEQFGSLTFEPAPVRGIWTHEGIQY